MTLVPMKGVLGGVAKMSERDPRAAANLVQLGLFEALQDSIEPVRQDMAEVVLHNIERVNKAARARVLRTVVAKGEAPTAYVEAIALVDQYVEKGLGGWLLSQFNREHPRDDKGRFVKYPVGQGTDPNLPIDPRRASHVADAVTRRDRWKQSGLINDKTQINIGLSLIDENGRPSGTVRRATIAANELEPTLAAAQDHIPVEISVARRNLNRMSPQQLAAVDLTSLATGYGLDQSKQMTRGLFDDNGQVKSGDQTQRNWNAGSEGTDRQVYRRTKMLGQALSATAVPGSGLSAVGGLAQLMGDIGPEAEKVLGPGIRRTAYRYRGTERRPDRDLVVSVDMATKYADALNDPETNEAAKESVITRAKARGRGDAAAIVAANYIDASLPEDQRDLSVRGGAAVASLLGIGKGKQASRLPDMELVELSLSSGEMPPSEGVIIDAHGRVVTQAVGYNGDHYLPFDLRNLASLHGGQYVRTRATGGPTTEDIYTALVTGARQIQVVSNSGVFTLEFDPDLRGARRFNDKVARMVERYGSILEAIHDPNSELYETDLKQEERAQIRRDAAKASRTQEEFKENVRRLTEQARLKGSVSADTEEEVEEYAYAHATARVERELKERGGTWTRQERARLIEDQAREIINNQDPGVRKLRLNGQGYNRALRALQQEFPYYIRTATFEPLPEWLRNRDLPTMGYRRGAKAEQGYVERGQTNTARARVGGTRSARYVPTGRAVKPTAAERPTAAPTERGAAQPAAASVAQPGAAPSAPKADVGSLVARQMASVFNPLVGTVSSVEPRALPAEEDTDDQVMRDHPPMVYLHRIASKTRDLAKPGQEGRAMADWFLKASPRQRATLMQGIADFAAHPDTKANDVDTSRVTAAATKIQELATLVEPFAQPEDDQPAWSVDPSEGKPASFGDAPPLDAPDEEWDRARAQLAIDDPDTADTVDHLERLSPDRRQEYVQQLFEEYEKARDRGGDLETPQRDLETHQRAWSFVHAHEVARKLRGLLGSDAGPKDQVGKSGPSPLALLLQEVRGELDSLLEQVQ